MPGDFHKGRFVDIEWFIGPVYTQFPDSATGTNPAFFRDLAVGTSDERPEFEYKLLTDNDLDSFLVWISSETGKLEQNAEIYSILLVKMRYNKIILNILIRFDSAVR